MSPQINQESKNNTNDPQGLKGCTFENSEKTHPNSYNPKYKKPKQTKQKFNLNDHYSTKPPKKGHYKGQGGYQGFGNFSKEQDNNDNTTHYHNPNTNYNVRDKPEPNLINNQNTINTVNNNSNNDQNSISFKNTSYKAKNDGYNIPISNINHIDTLTTEEKVICSKKVDDTENNNDNGNNLKIPMFTGKITTDRKVSNDQAISKNSKIEEKKNSENEFNEQPPAFNNTEKKVEIKWGNEDVIIFYLKYIFPKFSFFSFLIYFSKVVPEKTQAN